MRNEFVTRVKNKYINLAILIFALLMAIYFPALKKLANLEFNQVKWNSQNISHYRYKLDIVCHCSFSYAMPVTIEVRNGEIVSMLDADGAILGMRIFNYGIFEEYGTIERVFDSIQDNIFTGNMVHSVYDKEYGFPALILMDPERNTIDDERIYKIIDFEVLP